MTRFLLNMVTVILFVFSCVPYSQDQKLDPLCASKQTGVYISLYFFNYCTICHLA